MKKNRLEPELDIEKVIAYFGTSKDAAAFLKITPAAICYHRKNGLPELQHRRLLDGLPKTIINNLLKTK